MKSTRKILALLFLIILSSCEKDLYEDAIQESKRNTITLEQFKTETGINDFEKIIKIPFSNQSASQNKIAGLEDFIIDTEEILRRISNDNKTTYSFRIYPMDSNIEINQKFNLIYRKEDGIWEKSILSMIEDSPNQSFRTVSSVKEIFDTKHQVTMVEACYSTTQITFCDGRCSGNCDAKSPGGCPENTCHVFVAVVIGDCAEAGGGPQNPDIENPSNSGNSGYIPVNPYEFQPNLYDNPAYDDPDYLNAIKSDIFFSHLTPGEQTWTNETQENILAYNQLINYMIANNWSPKSVSFGNEIIKLANEEVNQADVSSLINLTILLNNAGENLYEDSFALSLDPYIDIDVANYMLTNPTDPLWMHFTIQCAVLRANHQDWSDAKIYWQASKDIFHIALDMLGLVPVVGEVADLTNGVLYTLEGDGVNATLSVASAVPIAGWAAVGTKYAVKVVNASQTAVTIATKVKLTWRLVGNSIDFGSSNQLRKVLGLAVGNADQAHHIMPWAERTHEVIQRAAKSGSAFHMNEALNGIAVAAWRNQPNHNVYNNKIKTKLNDYILDHPNATPQQCYNFISSLIEDVRSWVVSNPNSHLNDLVLP